MLRAFFDETGINSGDTVFIYAGFVAASESWVSFSDDWEAQCAIEPKTPNFHTVDAFRASKFYWGASTEAERVAARDQRFLDLANIVKRHALFRVNCGLGRPQFDEYLKGTVSKEFDDPLFWGFAHIMGELAKTHKGCGFTDKIDVVFDRQNRIEKYVPEWYAKMAEIDPAFDRIFSGPPSFRSDDEVLPLKAADMLAWGMQRNVRKRIESESRVPPKLPFLDVLLDVEWRSADLTLPAMIKIRETLKASFL